MVEKKKDVKTDVESKIAFIGKVVRSRTVWASIFGLMSLIVALKTGSVVSIIDVSDPLVTEAVRMAGVIFTIVSQILVVIFRYIGNDMKGD